MLNAKVRQTQLCQLTSTCVSDLAGACPGLLSEPSLGVAYQTTRDMPQTGTPLPMSCGLSWLVFLASALLQSTCTPPSITPLVTGGYTAHTIQESR
jgi:hypothetical protein